MTTFKITRRAKQTYNKRVTDHYEDTQTVTLAELAEVENCSPEEWLAMTPEEQEQSVQEYADQITADWELDNVVKTEDDGWADDPDEDYEEEFEIVKHQQPA